MKILYHAPERGRFTLPGRRRRTVARVELKLPDDLIQKLSALADRVDDIIPKALEDGGAVVVGLLYYANTDGPAADNAFDLSVFNQ
jgi:hypothetical protein